LSIENKWKKWFVFLSKFFYSVFWYVRQSGNIDVLITMTGPSKFVIPFIVLRSKKTQHVYFPYDICDFTPFFDIKTKIEKKLEKFCFLSADKIVYKGLSSELSHIKYYNLISKTPSYHFRDFISEKKIPPNVPKLSEKDGKIHLVYGGGWSYKKGIDTVSAFTIYEPFVRNNIHVHVYALAATKKQFEMFADFENKYSYFHYEGFKSHSELLREYPKYDFGLNFCGPLAGLKKYQWYVKSAFSNKIFDYISARLPIVVSLSTTALAEFVKSNDVGYILKDKMLYGKNPDFTFLYDKQRYVQMQKNIAEYITRSLQENKFLEFIKKK